MKKIILPLSILIITSLSINNEVNASSEDLLDIDTIEGEVRQISKNSVILETESVSLEEFQLYHENGEVKGTGSIHLNDSKSDLDFEGELYPIKGGGVLDSDILGDIISKNEDLNIISFMLQDEDSTLSIVVEDIRNQTWFEFDIEIDNAFFDSLSDGSEALVEKKEIDDIEQKETVLYLLNHNNKSVLINDEHPKSSKNIQGVTLADSDNLIHDDEGIGVQDVQEVNRALTDVKNSGSINLNNYSISDNVFKNDGWSTQYAANNDGYHKYSVDQGDSTLTQINWYAEGGSFSGYTSENVNRFDVTTTLMHGVVVNLNHNTNELSIFYRNTGLRNEDTNYGIFNLQGENVFRNQTINGSNLDSKGNGLTNFFVGLVPYADTITSLFDILTPNGGDNLGNTIGLPYVTFEDQVENLNGQVYRGIRADVSNQVMSSEGANYTFQGEIHSPDQNINLSWRREWTGYTNL